MSTISLENIRIYAYHGVFPVEQNVGQWYEISLEIESDTTKAESNDCLDDTIDYSALNSIIHDEMQIKSKLLEHVGKRIITAIQQKFPNITRGLLSIAKLNPPVKGTVGKVKIKLSF